MTLKRVEIPFYGPYVFGRKRSPGDGAFPSFDAVDAGRAFADINAIREAARSLHPIYATIGNMLGNDRWGVCACVAILKAMAIFDCAAGRQWRAPTLGDVIWLYKQFNPDFNPATGAGDDGCALEDVIDFAMKHGVYSDGTGKIKAAYAVDGANKDQATAALKAHGVLYVGCELPAAWIKQVKPGFVWGVEGPPDPDLGHSTLVYGENDNGPFDSTWGLEGTILWPGFAKYFASSAGGEVYALTPA